jgi:hypothetical protein
MMRYLQYGRHRATPIAPPMPEIVKTMERHGIGIREP